MLYTALHNRWLRILTIFLGETLVVAALRLFIVPQGLYSGGLTGFCQLLRTGLQALLHVDFGAYDIAGILYFILNIPILIMAYTTLGKKFVFRTVVCTVYYSLAYSLIPTPATPIVSDPLTSCLLGGILAGIGTGFVLTCGTCAGGLDIVGLILNKRGSHFSLGRFSLTFNAVLYAICLILFSAETAIYSVIYTVFNSMMLDRFHQQNVSMQVLIFTRADEHAMRDFIVEKLARSVTWWNATGGYTGGDVHVLCVYLSKFEIDDLRNAIRTVDPNAFMAVQEGVQVYGNFRKKMGD